MKLVQIKLNDEDFMLLNNLSEDLHMNKTEVFRTLLRNAVVLQKATSAVVVINENFAQEKST